MKKILVWFPCLGLFVTSKPTELFKNEETLWILLGWQFMWVLFFLFASFYLLIKALHI